MSITSLLLKEFEKFALKGFTAALQKEYIQALMELAGEVPRLANTTPAAFFAPRSQLSEVFPAC